MHCIRCGRPLYKTPSVAIPAKSGALYMGPKCALLAGLVKPACKSVKSKIRASINKEPGQMDIFVEMEKQNG